MVSTTDNNSGINIACGKGQLDVVKYLLSSNELKEQGLPLATMEFNHEGWWWAIEGGHLDVIQYLMTSPDLKKHIDIHKDQDKAFRLACERNQLEIIQYFIFEQLIPKTSDIKAYLKEQFNENQLGNKVVVNMFKVRDNYQKMQHSLEQKPAETKRFKI